MPEGQESQSYKCSKCKDVGYIFYKNKEGYSTAKKCDCTLQDEILKKADNSGLGDLIKKKKFNNFIANEEFQVNMKNKAQEFVKEFLANKTISFALLGQSGIGKSHIMAAVSRTLIAKNVQVRFYTADDIIQRLQACKFDELNYNKEFNDIANSQVLYIDDLFKSSLQNYYNTESINANDFREIFKIINYRYNKNLPILLNSEITFDRLIDLDEALAGRLNEMCKREYIISVRKDKNKNYRLKR